MSSNPIYTSTKTVPYVYRLDHPTTNEFYIGFRSANKVPSSSDLGIMYFTSSKIVKPRFHEFNITILAEFSDKLDAHEYEQSLIMEFWKSPLILNRAIFPKIRNTGQSEKQKSKARHRMMNNNPMKIDSNRQKAKERQTGNFASQTTKDKMSLMRKGKKLPKRDPNAQLGEKNPMYGKITAYNLITNQFCSITKEEFNLHRGTIYVGNQSKLIPTVVG